MRRRTPPPAPWERRQQASRCRGASARRRRPLWAQPSTSFSGLVKDRFSSGAKTSTDAPVTHAPQVDVTEQLRKLASLRDAGILSEEEFALKKTELLGRL
ncbi:MAG TPA: hypothetical protein DEA69_04760 [Microbacterium sp.]|nr:hypothetical protein [Microbacterium sp.]HBS08098.1 hypothetical protein [Microbacterium sp.]HBU42850.1 hypothetical protein [Microbacterium sp.]